MPYVDTPLVAGATLTWADIAANFTAARAWINDIPATDVGDATIQREHLVRPVISGYPINGTVGSFQRAHRATDIGMDPPTPHTYAEWGPKVARLTIKPECCRGAHSSGSANSLARWVLPIGQLLHAPKSMSCTVVCQFDIQVRSPLTGPFYPDGAGGGSTAGQFQLIVHDRVTNEEDLRQIRTVYPLDMATAAGAADSYVDAVKICSTFTLAAGDYDLALVYYRGNAATLVDQLDLTCITFHVEAL